MCRIPHIMLGIKHWQDASWSGMPFYFQIGTSLLRSLLNFVVHPSSYEAINLGGILDHLRAVWGLKTLLRIMLRDILFRLLQLIRIVPKRVR